GRRPRAAGRPARSSRSSGPAGRRRGSARSPRRRRNRSREEMSQPIPLAPPARLLDVEVDGRRARVPEGATILDACRAEGIDTPVMCYADNLTPVNACRVCVVEVEGSRVLVPACSRTAEAGMKISTDTERVRHSRKLVMEFLGSSVDTSLASADWHRWQDEYE